MPAVHDILSPCVPFMALLIHILLQALQGEEEQAEQEEQEEQVPLAKELASEVASGPLAGTSADRPAEISIGGVTIASRVPRQPCLVPWSGAARMGSQVTT